MGNQITDLAVQSWTLYTISISLIFSRFIFRRTTLGSFKKLQADDWMSLLILLPYTTSIVLANQIGSGKSATERKFRYVLEEMQIITIWLVKACLLVLYWRIFPTETSRAKRWSLKCGSLFCAVSFLVVQISLMTWCQPTEAYWDVFSSNPQCTTFHAHTALTLSFDVPNTIFIMILPVPFIPTPRRLLLTILLILSTLVLIAGILSRTSVLINPQQPSYLNWYISESTLGIIFANLPFLTSLVVTAAPARIRHFSSHLNLSQWPRSRRGSWAFHDAEAALPPLRTSRLGSNATTVTDLASPVECQKMPAWAMGDDSLKQDERPSPRHSATSSQGSSRESTPALPTPPVRRPETRNSQVPKMRLSGGLAEMGDLTIGDTQGWPIYWR
ncbi:hypothetical protein FB567DRAFT_87807 [Paraphoma chrysanthemicola]|uniref:Rhodopsin domain-containing protein n=1 Tax=Paraphoma chrysanthemicola TaxID=798071 RepID=A0A8K0VW42_9PLEO|nr:hypothetical protein FB567DRAFT_87807 [Paraphoma chrysanthemicola]